MSRYLCGEDDMTGICSMYVVRRDNVIFNIVNCEKVSWCSIIGRKGISSCGHIFLGECYESPVGGRTLIMVIGYSAAGRQAGNERFACFLGIYG